MLYYLSIIKDGHRVLASIGMPMTHARELMQRLKQEHPEYKVQMHDFQSMLDILGTIAHGAPKDLVEQTLDQVMSYAV